MSGSGWKTMRSAMLRFSSPNQTRSTSSWSVDRSARSTLLISEDTSVFQRLRAESKCRIRRGAKRRFCSCPRYLPVFRRRGCRFSQSISRLHGFVGSRIPLDDALQFLLAVFFFAKFEECEPLLQLCRSRLVSAREILHNQIIVGDCLLIIAGFEFNFRQIKIGVSGQIGVGIILHVIAEFLRRQVVLPAV